MVEAVLGGEPGARRDVVAAQRRGGAAGRGLRSEQLEEGIDKAALAIDAGVGDGAARQSCAPTERRAEAEAAEQAARADAPPPRARPA